MPYYFKSKLKPLIYKKHKQLSHETISILTGVNRPTITRWMGDRLLRRLDMDILEPIARWLECDPSDLYEIVEEP